MQGFVWFFSSVSIAQEAPHFYKSCFCSYLLQKTQLQLETVWLLGSREHLLFMYNPCVLVHQQVTYFFCNGLLVSAREMAANYLGWPPRIHHGFPLLFFLKKTPHMLDPTPLPYTGLKQSIPHCLRLLDKHKQQHNCWLVQLSTSLVSGNYKGKIWLVTEEDAAPGFIITSVGHTSRKAPEARYLFLHCCVITGE